MPKTAKLSNRIAFFAIALLMIPFFFISRNVIASFKSAQTDKEKVIKQLSWRDEPIELTGLKVNQKEVELNKSFSDDNDDWLKDLTIKFKNKHDKAVIYIRVGLDFPETKATGNEMSYPLTYGIEPREFARNPLVKERVGSGQTVELKLTEKKFEGLKSFIERRHLLSTLNKVNLRIGFILFEDGTAWSGGSFMRQDPANPNSYIPIDSIPSSIQKEKLR